MSEIDLVWLFLIGFCIVLVYLMYKAWDAEGEPKRKDLCYYMEEDKENV